MFIWVAKLHINCKNFKYLIKELIPYLICDIINYEILLKVQPYFQIKSSKK